MAGVRFSLLFIILGFAFSCMGDECDDQIENCFDMVVETIGNQSQSSTSPWKLREFANGKEVSEEFCLIIGKFDHAEAIDCIKNQVISCGDQKETKIKSASAKKAETSKEFALGFLHGRPCRNKDCPPEEGTTFNDLLRGSEICLRAKRRGELKEMDACRQNLPVDPSAPKDGETKCMKNEVKYCGYPATMSENAKIVMSFINLEPDKPETCTFYVNKGQCIQGCGLYVIILSMVLLIFTF